MYRFPWIHIANSHYGWMAINNQIASFDHGTHALWICDLSSICFGQVNHQHHQMDLQKCSMSLLDPKLRSILSRLMIVLTPLSGWWFGTFGLFFHILWMSSSQVTTSTSIIFQRCGYSNNHQPAMAADWFLTRFHPWLPSFAAWWVFLVESGCFCWIYRKVFLEKIPHQKMSLWLPKI